MILLLYTAIWGISNHFLQLGCKICKNAHVYKGLFSINRKEMLFITKKYLKGHEITDSSIYICGVFFYH